MAIDNVLTPQFRAAFISVFRASANKANPAAEPNFSIRAVFPPTTDLTNLKKAAQAAATEKFGASIPKTLRSPFRRNDELDNPVQGIGDDWMVMTFARKEKQGRPGLVDAQLQAIIDETDAYSGAWYRAQVRAYAYDQAGNKGVSFGLQNLQKLRDDEPLGGARARPEDVFEAVETGETSAGTTRGVFD